MTMTTTTTMIPVFPTMLEKKLWTRQSWSNYKLSNLLNCRLLRLQINDLLIKGPVRFHLLVVSSHRSIYHKVKYNQFSCTNTTSQLSTSRISSPYLWRPIYPHFHVRNQIHCGLSSNIYPTIFPRSQHPYSTRQSLGSNSHLSREGSRILAAIRRRMAESAFRVFKFQGKSVRKQAVRSFCCEMWYVVWSGERLRL